MAGVLLLGALSACSGGNPNVGAAEDALEQNNYQQALQSVQKAIDADSANAQAYMLKARILMQQARSTNDAERHAELVKRAIEAQEQAIQFNPGLREEVNTRRQFSYMQEARQGGQLFRTADSDTNAVADSVLFLRAASRFKAAQLIQPDSVVMLQNEAYARLRAGEQANAIPLLAAYVEKADSVGVESYTLLGNLYLVDGQAKKAIPVLEEGAEIYPTNQELQSMLLNAYNTAGMTEEAMKQYARQVKQNPENANYRYNYGTMLLQANRFDEAIEQLKAAVQYNEGNVKALYNLGAAYVNKAVAVDDSIAAIESEYQTGEIPQDKQATIKQLVERRKELFANAINPLEKARRLAESGSAYRADICRSLFTAYVQTNQQDKAKAVQSCAGFSGDQGSGGQ